MRIQITRMRVESLLLGENIDYVLFIAESLKANKEIQ